MAENIRTTPGLQVALTIAGSDSSGGAGIQADLKTFTVMGVYGAAVITTLTAQNTTGVKAKQVVDPQFVEQQIDAVASDLEIDAAKVGLAGDAKNIEIIAQAIKRHSLYPLVVDPVLISKSGSPLLDDKAVGVLCRQLLPLAAVITPNRFEAARLAGKESKDGELPLSAAADTAAQICRKYKLRACVITGFHRPNAEEGDAVDVFYDGSSAHEVVAAWRPTKNTHGAGCTFSAAITAALALGKDLPEAIEAAKNLVTEAIRQTTNLGAGTGPINHYAWLKVGK